MRRATNPDHRHRSLKRPHNEPQKFRHATKPSWTRTATALILFIGIISSCFLAYRQQQRLRLDSFSDFSTVDTTQSRHVLQTSESQLFTDTSSGGHVRLFDMNASSTITNQNFSGIMARSFSSWPLNLSFPCYQPRARWKEMAVQFAPAQQGFFFLKPYKTGSSTTSGVHLRIARNEAKRRTELKFDICNTRFDHGPDFYPGYTLFRRRFPERSFLWTILRDPTTRAISEFFHFFVARQKREPSDQTFKLFLRQSFHITDYYYRALYPKAKFDRKSEAPIAAANHILETYNFIGITERMDESLVVLMMLLRLKIADILYLSAKTRGGYDDAGGKSGQTCTYIWPSFVSPGMKEYFDSEEWREKIRYDILLYEAVNRSLDLTIDELGCEEFQKQLNVFKSAQAIARDRCLPNTTFPCDANGKFYPENSTDCIWKDSGCGTTCLDEIATELNLW